MYGDFNEVVSRSDDRDKPAVGSTQEADADIGYFELKLEEFKKNFSDAFIENLIRKQEDVSSN